MLSEDGGEIQPGSSSNAPENDQSVSTTSKPEMEKENIAIPTTMSCEMCQNYEINLTIMQDNEKRLKEEIKSIKELSDRHETELSSEREYRADLEKKMIELAAQMEDEVKDYSRSNIALEKRLEELSTKLSEATEASKGELEDMKQLCQRLESDLTGITEKYKNLLGLNRATASAMRSEAIDLPTDVDQLQFRCLQMREELIESKSARQHIDEELKDEIATIKLQLSEERRVREGMERDYLGQVNDLQTQLGVANSKLSSTGNAMAMKDEHVRQIRDLQQTIGELEGQVAQVQHERAAVEKTAQNYKSRCSSLQTELDTSEAVQKDFVKLSQSLQIQLEKIRQSEQEVRWQWEDEHQNCSGCEASISKLKSKPRCLHCCKLFCVSCLKHTVPSGANKRPAPVCQVCHTLLNRDSKPFFAQDGS